ncbi:MAG: bifunctional hydroxymethylpyrimidine kinase/phosphomethylpyrimidine kinase [Rhodospirillales bacterium]|nr:bifunctional hydroxymethylpyrimidine kinase/phosphomethylpyrimidine kinase [Rhodospirillales bacterium]
MQGRVLAIAGSDSGGGAGIQADVKTITALGAYAATAITALTVQDTRAVYAVHRLPPSFIKAEIERALADPGADAVKIGMLGDAETAAAVATALRPVAGIPLVIDPVLLASSGAKLLAEDALDILRAELFPLATLITPNIPETARLSGLAVCDQASMERAARALRSGGGMGAVLVKGGHLSGETVVDVLACAGGITRFEAPRLPGPPRHGTGCTLAAAIAAGLAQGLALLAAIQLARAYVRAAIATAPAIGAGAGPLNHAVTLDPGRIPPLGE